MKNILTTIVLSVFSFLSLSQAQNIEWLFEPIISDVERISRVIPELELIEVGGKSKTVGVKNFRNEIIIPVDHSHVSVFLDVSYIAANRDGEKLYYDHEGYEIDESISDQTGAAYQKTQGKKKEKAKEEYNSIMKNFKLHNTLFPPNSSGVKEEGYALINLEGDTLIKKVRDPRGIKLLGEDHFMFYFKVPYPDNKNSRNRIMNAKGDILLESEKSRLPAYEVESGYIVVEDQRNRKLYDADFNQVGQDFQAVKTFKRLKHFTYQLNDEYFLADGAGNMDLIGKPSKFIGRAGESDNFFIKNEEACGSYNIKTNELTTFDFFLKSYYSKQQAQLVNRDTIYGAFDFEVNEFLVPIEYRTLTYRSSFFIGYDKKFTRRDRSPKTYSVYNPQGQLVLNQELKSIKILKDGYFLARDTSDMMTLYDKTGEVILKPAEGEEFSNSQNHAWIKIKDKKGENDYLVADLAQGKKTSYPKIGKTIAESWVEDQALILVYDKNKKCGAITLDNKLVIPIEFDSIEKMSIESKYYLQVKKDGKFGIMLWP